ncbi:hypothetical protein MTO96_005570 [Rhipicephalus appendiculatus]
MSSLASMLDSACVASENSSRGAIVSFLDSGIYISEVVPAEGTGAKLLYFDACTPLGPPVPQRRRKRGQLSEVGLVKNTDESFEWMMSPAAATPRRPRD